MLGLTELIIFLFVFCFCIGKNRTTNMIDIITTRFQEAYTWIVTENGKQHQQQQQQTNSGSYLSEQHNTSIKRLNDDCQSHQQHQQTNHRRVLSKAKENNNINKSYVMQDKEEVMIRPKPRLSLDGLICQDCSKNLNTKSLLDPVNRSRNAVDILKVTQHATNKGKMDWGSYFPHIAQNLRLKKFPYPPIFDKVLNHQRMKSVLDKAAKESVRNTETELKDEDQYFEEMLKKHTHRAHKLLIDMRSKLSDKLLRFTSYMLFKLLPCFLSGCAAHPAQIQMLKEAQNKMPGTPLIFLPLHRSHLDYILVTMILLNNDIRCPKVVAGNNLNIPVFGVLLRGLGACFIKRKIDGPDGKKDYIYRSLLQCYLQESIISGHNIEFFIEGGRTRTGKPNLPKSGILSVIVDAFADGIIDDAILVPVSINYEKLVDGNFVNEQQGVPKQRETFKTAIASIWKILNSHFGLMRIDFNEPFSLKELVKSFNESKNENIPAPGARKLLTGPSTTSLYGIEVIDKHRVLVDNIARHVVYDCSYATSIMSTNAVAYLLLNRFRQGASLKMIADTLTQLRLQIGNNRDFAFSEESTEVVKNAVKLLGPGLVQQQQSADQQTFIKPVLMVPNVIELAYYSNTFVPHFALDAVVITALATTNGQPIQTDTIIETSLEYCDILRYEFILCKPCQNLAQQIEGSIRRLVQLGTIQKSTSNVSNAEVMLNIDKKQSNEHQTLLSTLAPFNITYHAVAECLSQLLTHTSMVEADFIKKCLVNITDKVNSGNITYGESISTDSIRNCIKLLEKWQVMETEVASGSVRLVSLCLLYNSPTGVQSIIDKIGRFVIME